MLMKLCNDDLPLKLGQRLPRPEEKAKNIAEMERVAKVFDDTAVKWVVDPNTPEGGIDVTITDSDRQHPLAQERQRMYTYDEAAPILEERWNNAAGDVIKRWFDENCGKVVETRIAPQAVYVAPIRSQFTPTTEQIAALNRATESMRDGINRDYGALDRLDRAERAANPPACAICGISLNGQKHFLHCTTNYGQP